MTENHDTEKTQTKETEKTKAEVTENTTETSNSLSQILSGIAALLSLAALVIAIRKK